MPIGPYFETVEQLRPRYTWTTHRYVQARIARQDLALELARDIVQSRCVATPARFAAWERRRSGGPAHTPPDLAALLAFLKPGFGIPGQNSPVPTSHLEGLVAECLWHNLTRELASQGRMRWVQPLKLRATHAGGDGLTVHDESGESLLFRLWEIKKATGNHGVSRTVSTAYAQLKSRALEYLAEVSLIGETEHRNDPPMRQLFAQMVDLWIAGSPVAAAGVAVATSTSKIPRRCFSTFPGHFPQFASPRRLEGILLAVDDFGAFAREVQEAIWKGL